MFAYYPLARLAGVRLVEEDADAVEVTAHAVHGAVLLGELRLRLEEHDGETAWQHGPQGEYWRKPTCVLGGHIDHEGDGWWERSAYRA